MPVILIEKDPFVAAFDDPSGATETAPVNVRRPLNGISVKENAYAYLSVVTSAGQKVALLNSSAQKYDDYGKASQTHNFILQSVQFSRQERVQVQETFGDFYTFFFGESPSVASLSGILFNTKDFNWKNEFLRNYDQYLRGTKCVETRSRVYLGFDDVLLEGYMLNVSIPQQSDAPYLVAFTCSFLITQYMDLTTTYSSTVKSIEEVRTNSAGQATEYLTGTSLDETLVEFDTSTGGWAQTQEVSLGASREPLQDESPAVAFSGHNNQEKLYLSASEALVKIDVDTQVQQKGTDRTTALLARAKDSAGSFPLSKRTDAVASIESSLNTKVAFGAAVISDQPDLT
jgi:hypothetical protein